MRGQGCLFLGLALCLAGCTCAPGSERRAAPPDRSFHDGSSDYFEGLERPRGDVLNLTKGGPFILIIVDALRPDHMTPYGYGRDTTPNLNALADDGVVFTNAFVNANWTRPSTASLLTGQLPSTHCVEADGARLNPSATTLAERLTDAGIATAAVVGNGNAGKAFGMDQGFQHYADTTGHWDGLPSAEEVRGLALGYLEGPLKEKDEFFLMLFLVDPHDPYHAPAEYEAKFVRDPSVPLVQSPHWELGASLTEAQRHRIVDTYDAALAYTDDQLGLLMAKLKAMGLYDRSTIVVTADHGEAFGEHDVFLHAHHFYDEIVRVPLVWKPPAGTVGEGRGTYLPHMTQWLDLHAAVRTHFGLPRGREESGLAQPIQDLVVAAARPRGVVSEFHNFGIRRRMWRSDRMKVVHQRPADRAAFMKAVGNPKYLPSVRFDAETWKVFDLVRDPRERTPLPSEDARATEAIKLAKAAFQRIPAQACGARSYGEVDEETLRDLEAMGYLDVAPDSTEAH